MTVLRKVMAATIACFLLTTQSLSQATDVKERSTAAKTQFEQFTSADGKLLIAEYYDVRSPATKYGKSNTHLVRVSDANSGDSRIALRIEFKGDDRFDTTHRSILDHDEIISLAKAIDFINANLKRISESATTYTEVKYTSRGGFQVGFYYEPADNSTGYFMLIGLETVFLTSLADLNTCTQDSLNIIKSLPQ